MPTPLPSEPLTLASVRHYITTPTPLLRAAREAAEGIFVATPTRGWETLAASLSAQRGGQWWPSVGGVTWVCGRRRQWILDQKAYYAAREAREAAQLLGVEAGWTVGSVARALLKWMGEKQRPNARVEEWVKETGWHYFLCRPGEYRDSQLVDMKGAYYHLLRRLPSPCVRADHRGVYFMQSTPEVGSRWRDMLELVGEHKLLRNSLVGACAGGEHPRAVYIRGQRVMMHPQRGPLRSAALLVVRTCWEMCQRQAEESGAYYANTDCVISPQDVTMRVWESYGVPFRREAYGDAEIRALNVYRIGSKRTVYHRAGTRVWLPTEAPPTPREWVSRMWL